MRPVVSMRISVSAAFSILLLPAGGSAQTYLVQRVGPGSAKGYEDVHISKAAIAGHQVRVWWATSLNPDCTAAATMTTDILDQPRHGRISLSDDPFYPNFTPPNPRAACDTVKSPGRQAFYTADAGFHGHDRIVLRNATSEGRMRRVIVDIDVE